MSDQAYTFNPSATRFTIQQGAPKENSLITEEMQSAILNLRERLTTLEQTCASAPAPAPAEVTPCCSSCDCVSSLEARLGALEGAVASASALEARLAALEASFATAPAAAPVQHETTKLRIVSMNYDTYGADSILNEQGLYRNTLSYGSDVIVKVSSTQEFVRYCVDWAAPVGTVIKMICDAPKLRFEGEGWTVLYEISQGESYTFVKEEDGWKGYAGILLV
jgi:hypothetical protein